MPYPLGYQGQQNLGHLKGLLLSYVDRIFLTYTREAQGCQTRFWYFVCVTEFPKSTTSGKPNSGILNLPTYNDSSMTYNWLPKVNTLIFVTAQSFLALWAL